MFFLLLFLFQTGDAQFVTANQQLYCNRIVGNFHNQVVRFARPLQNGDMITWSGTEWSFSVRFSLFHRYQFTLHIRQDLPQQRTGFNTATVGWMNAFFGPALFQIGQPFLISVKFLNNQFQIFSNQALRYTYSARSPTDNITAAFTQGSLVLNWIEMECANPPFTTSAPRPSRRPGHGNGGHGGHGHGGYGGFSSSSGSSSDESC
uniref:Galectin n=1 Tax=Caenorhabditis tropicalis TaxID=1561998 RepID=A0A1I7UGA6_9PELO